jgi:vacuolar-type H+-ATPase subunit I/STV1
MLVPAQDYQQKIQEIQSGLATAFQALKQVHQADRKEKERIKKRIKKLYEQLQDLKYRSAYM